MSKASVGWPPKLLLRLSLHSRIAVFMSAILLAVSLAFAYIGMEALNRSTQAVLDERKSTAILVARHLDELVQNGKAHVEQVADYLRDYPGALDNRELRDRVLADSFSLNDDLFSRLLIIDTAGQLVASAPQATSYQVDPDVQEVIAVGLRAGYPTVSNLVRLPVEGSLGVLFVTPIRVGSRAFGLVAGEITIPHPAFSGVAESLKLGQTGHMEVIDARGRVLSSTFADRVGEMTEHPTFYLPLLYARSMDVGSARHVARPGERVADETHVMAFATIENAPWGIGLGQNETETFAVVSDLRNRAIAMAAIALIAALYLTWLGTLSVVRPIRALTSAGERMATGDLSEPIRIDQPDEVGRLAKVVETMRQRLGQSLSEIKAWNRLLEQRVHERTSALETSNRHLQALMNVATAVSMASDRRQVLNEALQAIVGTLGTVHAWAFLWDKDAQRLRLAADFGPTKVEDKDLALEAVARACDRSLEDSAACCRPGVGCSMDAPEKDGEPEVCWCAPMRVGAQAFGRLCMAIGPERHLEPEELALVDGIAQQVAVFFEKASLIEERTRFEARRHMERLRAEFLASVSHELRTPLGFIKGYTTTMLRDDVTWDPAQQREFLRIVDEESDRLTNLVDTLLDVAREQAGRLPMHFQSVSVEHVVRISIERMAHSIGKQRIDLQLEGSPTIVADGARLEQVIVNLLQNAVKYSPKDSRVEIAVVETAEGVRISVLDRGFGMPAVEIPHIFEPFYRVANGPTLAAGGAGLGLTICRAIVEAHGGRIWAEARAGGGTAITLALPAQPPEKGEHTDEQEVRVGG